MQKIAKKGTLVFLADFHKDCCIYLLTLFTNVSIEANSVDSDQAAPIIAA